MNGYLEFEREEMRELGYRVVDLLVTHFAELAELPVSRVGTRAELENLLREPLPEEPSDGQVVLDQAVQAIFSHMMLTTHPRFLAYVPSPSNYVSVLADALASGFNPFAGTWMEASGPAQVELVVLGWLAELVGFPPEAGGLFTSGGSAANLTALAVARQTRLGGVDPQGVVYFSDQTHSSVARALKILGFGPAQIRVLESTSDYRLSPENLSRAVEADLSAGRRPFCVVANAGTTNTGAVDPLPALADYCRSQRMWLHVDGAFGAAAALTERGRAALDGLGRADSLVIDPHKWLFQPYEIGCLLVRREGALADTFHLMPEYLRDLEARAGEVNFSDRGLQLTRGFRALKLWMSLKVFGVEAFREGIARGIELAEQAARLVKQAPFLELVTPAHLGVLTFRYKPPELPESELHDLNRRLVERVSADGRALVSTTELGGRTVIRMCTINPRTTEADLETVLQLLQTFGGELRPPEEAGTDAG